MIKAILSSNHIHHLLASNLLLPLGIIIFHYVLVIFKAKRRTTSHSYHRIARSEQSLTVRPSKKQSLKS